MRRQPCIIIRDELVSCVRGEPVFEGMAIGVALRHPVLGLRWLVTAHLDASVSREKYRTTITDLMHVLSAAPRGAAVVCGVDANTSLMGVDASGLRIGHCLHPLRLRECFGIAFVLRGCF